MWQQQIPPVPSPSNLLTVPIPELDMDHTPRLTAFPQNTQGAINYSAPSQPPPSSMMMPISDMQYPVVIPEHSSPLPMTTIDPFDLTADLESYNMGLRTFGITMPHDQYGMPELDEIDYSQLYCSNPVEQQR